MINAEKPGFSALVQTIVNCRANAFANQRAELALTLRDVEAQKPGCDLLRLM